MFQKTITLISHFSAKCKEMTGEWRLLISTLLYLDFFVAQLRDFDVSWCQGFRKCNLTLCVVVSFPDFVSFLQGGISFTIILKFNSVRQVLSFDNLVFFFVFCQSPFHLLELYLTLSLHFCLFL